MNFTYSMLLKILEEKFGFAFFDEEEDDFNINDYISDSILFIQFILVIESEIGIDLTDDFLDLEILKSAKGFVEKLDSFMSSQDKTNSSSDCLHEK